jgi:hypothetical protein
MRETVYEENGYADREDYLNCLADDFDVDIDTVKSIAEVLGEIEDFDGLVVALEDYTIENDLDF